MARKTTDATKSWLAAMDACYAPAASDEDWAAAVLAALALAVCKGPGLGLSIFEEAEDGRAVRTVVGHGEVTTAFVQLTQSAIRLEERAYRAMYYPKNLVVRASNAFRAALGAQAFLEEAAQFGRFDDALGLLIYPRPGIVGVIATFLPRSYEMCRNTRRRAHVLRQHVESGLRLRMRSSDEPVAVITPEGMVVDATGAGRDSGSAAALSTHVRRIEGARTNVDRAFETWSSLVEGRWSVVLRTEGDGRRFYFAYENAGNVRHDRALTRTEHDVVLHLVRGMSSKAAASELGLSPSAVSRALAAVLRKLGFDREVDMLRVAGYLHQQPTRDLPLTKAERKIYDLVVQGYSNAEIANAQGVSVNTVACQVGSILRKSGLPGRRALCALSLTEGRECAGALTENTNS